jgi:phosphatidylserine/phosphatidylglycerophosphate/cardiolipin synthase-like enzyme
MRKSIEKNNLKIVAISGTYVVVLGFNLPKNLCKGLLGFSIHRTDHTENESYYLKGMKCFEATDPGLPSGSNYSTKDHPIQSFQWADYSAKPDHKYTYSICALKGSPASLIEFRKTTLDISTEKPNAIKHDVYFNRGTAGSQEYIRRFGDNEPVDVPNNAAFDWLSRGLYEGMTKFVEDCIPNKHSLRIAAYEFNYLPFLKVIKSVIDKGVDVQIIYDGRDDSVRERSEKEIKKVKLTKNCSPRKEGSSYISHNKFMVKLENKVPIAVWTGGTNFSEGGIFGHSNVAHVIEDKKVAKMYLDFWTVLKDDLTVANTKMENELISSIPNIPPPIGASALFSPRTSLDALHYYADLGMTAKEGLFMTFAFGMNKVFKDVYKNSVAPLRFALLEKKTRPYKTADNEAKVIDEKEIQSLRNMVENTFAIGEFIRTNKFDGWVKERLTGLNKNVNYVHNKFMLIDPLSDDPIVIVGSANFSDASTIKNDENMLIIRKNKRIADIYFGEYMRLFSHFSFRESLMKFRSPLGNPKLLKTDDWWKEYFGNTNRSVKRKYFAKVNG